MNLLALLLDGPYGGLAVLVRRQCCAVGATVRWAVDDEAPSAVEEGT